MPPPSSLHDVAVRGENADWFATEVRAHEPSLRSYLRHSFPGISDQDDLVQESFLRIWKARLSRAIESPKHFLFRIARNAAIDAIRRRERSPVRPVADLAALPIAEDRPDAAEQETRAEELRMLAEAVDQLPRAVRTVIVLRQIDGLSQREIASRLGLSELTVQKYVVRGLDRLERALANRRGR